MVAGFAEISRQIIDQCVAQGVPFARDYAGLLDNRSFGGVQVSRTFYARGQTGQQLLIGAYQAMERQVAAGTVPQYPRHEMLEVIVVDGNSTDNTVAVARRTLPWARVITQTRKGKGNAMACGFAAATGDAIVMFDADGSADPQEIPRFVAALVEGADFAKGSRFTKGGGSDDITLLRKGGNAGLNLIANTLFGTRYSDLCYGYNAFWADLLPQLELPDPAAPQPEDGSMLWGDGFEIETVLNCRVAAADLTITEVPSVERERMFGETNLRTFADGTRVLRTLMAEHRRMEQRRKASGYAR